MNPVTFTAKSLPSDLTPSGNSRPSDAEISWALSSELLLKSERFARELPANLCDILRAALRALLLRYEHTSIGTQERTFRDLLPLDSSCAENVSSEITQRFSTQGFKVGFAGHDKLEGIDLGLNVSRAPRITWNYRPDLFTAEAVERIHNHFCRLLTGLLHNINSSIYEPALLSRQEQEKVVRAWNETRSEYAQNSSIGQLFEQAARNFPNQIAVVDGPQRLTYQELNHRADDLAAYLMEQGVEPATRVGLAMDRSAAMIVAMIAVLKCGAAYVPLDASYPPERLRFMIEDTAPRLILSSRKNRGKFAADLRCIAIEDVQHFRPRDLPAHERRATSDSTAYIMYTSGSTGQPKGVEVLHRGIIRLVKNAGYVDFGPEEVFGQISNSSFDAITFEVWGALLNGARLVILPTQVVLSPDAFAAAIREHNISAMFLTSSLFNFVAARRPDAFSTMRHLLVGGDAVDPRWARRVLEMGAPKRLINGYGPTECTTFAVTHHIAEVPANAALVPIGRPLGNTQAYVLDHKMRPVPPCIPGELYLGGDGLAKGYWNRPELTRERFVPSPFDPEARLYKTGDLARYRADGVIECLGRLDRQVKLRGFRIELGEIEAALRTHPQVRDCVLALAGDANTQRTLVAYVATDARSQLTTAEVRQYLRERLPEFMLPAAVVFLDELPLSANGKIDRERLPRFEGPVLADPKSLVPMTEAQQIIAFAWKNALGIQRAGLDDNFFDIGGDSLRMAAVETDLRASFTVPFTLVDLFEHPTIRTLAAHLTKAEERASLMAEAQQRARRQQTALSGMRTVRRGA